MCNCTFWICFIDGVLELCTELVVTFSIHFPNSFRISFFLFLFFKPRVFCFSSPEKVIFKPNDVSVFSTLSVNGRLFACLRDQLDSLVCESLSLTITFSLYDSKNSCRFTEGLLILRSVHSYSNNLTFVQLLKSVIMGKPSLCLYVGVAEKR